MGFIKGNSLVFLQVSSSAKWNKHLLWLWSYFLQGLEWSKINQPNKKCWAIQKHSATLEKYLKSFWVNKCYQKHYGPISAVFLCRMNDPGQCASLMQLYWFWDLAWVSSPSTVLRVWIISARSRGRELRCQWALIVSQWVLIVSIANIIHKVIGLRKKWKKKKAFYTSFIYNSPQRRLQYCIWNLEF